MKIDEVVRLIDTLKAAYPRMEHFSDDNVKMVWLKAFEDLDGEKAMKAVWVCIKKYEFMPSIAQVIKEYEDVVAESKKDEAAIITHYDQMRSTYGGDGEIREYLELFRERCGNTVEGADRLHKAMDAFVNSCTYTYTPYLDDAIRCIDIQTHTIPMEIMELMQENKRKSRLPEEVIRKHSKIGSSKPVDEL